MFAAPPLARSGSGWTSLAPFLIGRGREDPSDAEHRRPSCPGPPRIALSRPLGLEGRPDAGTPRRGRLDHFGRLSGESPAGVNVVSVDAWARHSPLLSLNSPDQRLCRVQSVS